MWRGGAWEVFFERYATVTRIARPHDGDRDDDTADAGAAGTGEGQVWTFS